MAREQNQNIQLEHSMIHQFAIATKCLPINLKSVLDNNAAKVINFIKRSPFNCRKLRQQNENNKNAGHN